MLEKIPGMGRLEDRLWRAGLITQEEIEEIHRRLRDRRVTAFAKFMRKAVDNHWLDRAIVRMAETQYDLAVVIAPYPYAYSKEKAYWLGGLYLAADSGVQPPLLQDKLPFSTRVANDIVTCLKLQPKGTGTIKTYPGLYPAAITYSEPWGQDDSREQEVEEVYPAETPQAAVEEILRRYRGMVYQQIKLERLWIYFDERWHSVTPKEKLGRPTHIDWQIR